MKKQALAIALTTLTLGAAHAAEPAWTGEAELGVVLASGNTDTTTANGKLDMDYAAGTWRHNIFADAYYASDDDEKTAERYALGYKPKYFFTDKDYVFGLLRYDSDEFADIDHRTTEVVGYGRQLISTDVHYLEAEIGAGARQSDYIVNADNLDENEGIVYLGGKYTGRISSSARFLETLRVEVGNENTFVESITGLQLAIAGNLSAKVSYTVRHNTDVVGAKGEHTDTITGVNLVYGF